MQTSANKRHRVLVANTDARIGLAVLRSLGRNGVETHAAQAGPSGLGVHSRYCSGCMFLPRDNNQFAAAVLTYIRQHRITHLIATSERDAFLLNERRAELEDVVEPLFPNQTVFDRALYKDRTLAIAQRCGIEAPRTICLRTTEDVFRCAELRFPVILKPRHHSPTGGIHTEFQSKILQFESFEELLRNAIPYVSRVDPPMAQEFANGCGVGISILMRGGEPLCVVQHMRVREDPPSGGVSVFCRTVPLDAGLVERSVQLLRAMEWEGVAMVEYRLDPDSRRAVLMEVNGRFWGSLPLALHAGADFPYLLYRSSFEKCEPYVGIPGVWGRWLFGDTKYLYLVWRDGSEPKLRALAAYLAAFRPRVKYFVWAQDDPMPALHKTLNSFRRLIQTGSLRESDEAYAGSGRNTSAAADRMSGVNAKCER